jgi:ferredoxin
MAKQIVNLGNAGNAPKNCTLCQQTVHIFLYGSQNQQRLFLYTALTGEFLGVITKLRKATISFVMSVRPPCVSVCPHGMTVRLMEFRKNTDVYCEKCRGQINTFCEQSQE